MYHLWPCTSKSCLTSHLSSHYFTMPRPIYLTPCHRESQPLCHCVPVPGLSSLKNKPETIRYGKNVYDAWDFTFYFYMNGKILSASIEPYRTATIRRNPLTHRIVIIVFSTFLEKKSREKKIRYTQQQDNQDHQSQEHQQLLPL